MCQGVFVAFHAILQAENSSAIIAPLSERLSQPIHTSVKPFSIQLATMCASLFAELIKLNAKKIETLHCLQTIVDVFVR